MCCSIKKTPKTKQIEESHITFLFCAFIVDHLSVWAAFVYHCRLCLCKKLKLSEHVDVCVCSCGRGRNRSWLSGRWRFKIWQSFKDFILGLFLVFAPVRTPGANFCLPRDWKVFRWCFYLQQFPGLFKRVGSLN